MAAKAQDAQHGTAGPHCPPQVPMSAPNTCLHVTTPSVPVPPSIPCSPMPKPLYGASTPSVAMYALTLPLACARAAWGRVRGQGTPRQVRPLVHVFVHDDWSRPHNTCGDCVQRVTSGAKRDGGGGAERPYGERGRPRCAGMGRFWRRWTVPLQKATAHLCSVVLHYRLVGNAAPGHTDVGPWHPARSNLCALHLPAANPPTCFSHRTAMAPTSTSLWYAAGIESAWGQWGKRGGTRRQHRTAAAGAPRQGEVPHNSRLNPPSCVRSPHAMHCRYTSSCTAYRGVVDSIRRWEGPGGACWLGKCSWRAPSIARERSRCSAI